MSIGPDTNLQHIVFTTCKGATGEAGVHSSQVIIDMSHNPSGDPQAEFALIPPKKRECPICRALTVATGSELMRGDFITPDEYY